MAAEIVEDSLSGDLKRILTAKDSLHARMLVPQLNNSTYVVSNQSILKTNLKPMAITENIIIMVQETNVNINPIVRPYSSQTGRLKNSQVIVSKQLTTVANISDGRDERIVSIMRIITVNRSTKVKRINNIAVESR
uniref:Uncharacterized protein n=1 Tax=Glossina pallidipes TaxID=7398 RepID=A0A1A9ZGZ7_GLOPL